MCDSNAHFILRGALKIMGPIPWILITDQFWVMLYRFKTKYLYADFLDLHK